MINAIRLVGWVERQRLGKNWDEWLHNGLASFETRPLGAPQDEGKAWIASRKLLILRRPQSGRLEGRTAPIQPVMVFLPSLHAQPVLQILDFESCDWV
jgi:hypothetical protein